MTGLIRSELLKVRTTNPWWIFTIAFVAATGVALLTNCLQASFYLDQEPPNTEGMDAESARRMMADFAAQSKVAVQAANIFTSGQYFGGLFVLLIAALLVTNEFYHQTATATFLTTPVRGAVVVAKMVTGVVFAIGFWLLSTVINLVVGVLFLQWKDLSPHLGDWIVQRAILFNLLVFALWAVLGVGFGALIRNQIGATVTASLLYTVGASIVGFAFFLIREFLIKDDLVLKFQVVMPSVAAQVFTSGTQTADTPPYWVGGLVLLGYGLVASVIGTLMIQRRDIS